MQKNTALGEFGEKINFRGDFCGLGWGFLFGGVFVCLFFGFSFCDLAIASTVDSLKQKGGLRKVPM